MSTQAQPQQQDDKNANKGISISTQPPTDGVISPAIRTSLPPNNHKNNSNKSLLPRQQSAMTLYQRLPRKRTNPESKKLCPLTPRRNSEETLLTSRLSREASRLKSSSRKSSSSIQSGTPSKLMTHLARNKEMMLEHLLLRWILSQNQLNNLKNSSQRRPRNQRSSRKNNSWRPFSRNSIKVNRRLKMVRERRKRRKISLKKRRPSSPRKRQKRRSRSRRKLKILQSIGTKVDM